MRLLTLFLLINLTTSLFADIKTPIRLGLIAGLTGNSAVVGNELLRGVQLVIENINSHGGVDGHKIELIVEDDSYQVNKSLTAYTKLLGQGTKFMFVATYGAVFTLGARADRDGVLLLDILDCNDDLAAIGENTFCLASRTESIAENFVAEINARENKKTAVLYEEEAWFNFIVKGLKAKLGKDALFLNVQMDEVDYKSFLLKAKQAGAENIIFLGNDSMGKAMNQARALGIKAQFYSIASVTSPAFQKLAGISLEGTIVSSWIGADTAEYKKFEAAYQNKFSSKPLIEVISTPAYDGASVTVRALSSIKIEGKGALDVAFLKQALLNLPAFNGACGTIKFDKDGAVRSINEKVYVMEGGKLVSK